MFFFYFACQWEGLIARRSGRFEIALAAFGAARRAAEEEENPTQAVFLASEEGITWQEAGDFERAKAVLAEAATEADALGFHTWAARWRRSEDIVTPTGDEAAPDKLARAQALLAHVGSSGHGQVNIAIARLSA